MTLKIVLTDCDTVNANDLDLSVFKQFGEVEYYGETPKELIGERIKDADVVICNKTVIGKAEIDATEHLKLITLFATGYNNIDVVYAREKGVAVCNAGVYSTNAVAQHVMAFILNHASKVADYDRDIKEGTWIRSRLFSLFSRPTEELAGKTLGIFGYGAIGRKVADLALAFDMKVIVNTRTPKDDSRVSFVDFDTLLGESDYLSLNCPLTPETKERFGKAEFAKMKEGAYFINTARGGVINETALREALESGRLSGAAIDVLTTEPMSKDCVLLGAPNITITPHIAWAALETRRRVVDIVVENIRRFVAGNPQNLVN